MRYNGLKEGADHQRLKKLLKESLQADPEVAPDSLAVEQRWWGVVDESKWRTPDVTAVRDGIRIAFEVQLSTTFLNVMRERHQFYRENGGLLFWIFREAQQVDPRQMQDDVFFTNNSNLFVVDDETRELSQKHCCLTLRCFYLEPQLDGPELWRERLITFPELTIDLPRQRVFYFDNEAARAAVVAMQEARARELLREQFIDFWLTYDAIPDEARHDACQRLINKLADAGIIVQSEPTRDLLRFAWLCLSAQAGHPVGFGHKTLLEVANYAMDNCPELVHYFLTVANRAGTISVLLAQDDAAGTKRRRQGKPHDPWRERISRFRASYQLARRRESGPYPIDQSFGILFNLLFPSDIALVASQDE
ncbi:hypothetical protein KI810_14565 [Geobacter luticola]|uniref:DUF6035 domain-containing protein n=2 Tax=Geomobilimonas luticola TaxID=1114878 RepID=A0ABS5SFZ7_9BACT|nr:hypothetical protein [Geomobilimonas luticola]